MQNLMKIDTFKIPVTISVRDINFVLKINDAYVLTIDKIVTRFPLLASFIERSYDKEQLQAEEKIEYYFEMFGP